MNAPRNVTGGPRFDRPLTTCTPHEAAVQLGLDQRDFANLIGDPAPLPKLIESIRTPLSETAANNDEPLVSLQHRRVRLLSNYFHAGWEHAEPTGWLRAAAAKRVYAAADSLPDRFGLAVFDAYRPLLLQAELFNAAYSDSDLPPGFVAEPIAELTTPPPHSTGGTIDCTLTIDGIALSLGTAFDDFTDQAWTGALETDASSAFDGSTFDRDLRRLLYWTMHQVGFVVLDCEWWHFEYGTRRWAGINGAEAIYGRADHLPR
jgi:zinc D-Ala-D-Ala dipeptidase